jgi:cytosine/adenosine deaminase-related metal-dependent hydrolase
VRPLELVEALSDEELDALTAHNLAELVRSGCTTQVEMSLSLRQAQSYARVAQRFGARGYLGPMVPGIARLFPIWFRREDRVLDESAAGTLAEIAEALAFARSLKVAGGLVYPMMTAHATDTHTPETMAALLAAVREIGTGLHIHLSQSSRETDTVRRLRGSSPATWLESLGFAGVPVFAAHLSGIAPGDLDVLKRQTITYAHCPSAGGAGAGGALQPYPEALAAGLPSAIGIDTHSNDMLENVKQAVILGRARARLMAALGSKDPVKQPSIWTALDGATRVPAAGLRRPDLGRIAEGARADLAAVDVRDLLVGVGAVPPEPLNHLLYANGTAVRHVLTEGRFQVFEGHLAVADEAEVIGRGGDVVRSIWATLDREGWFQPTPR